MIYFVLTTANTAEFKQLSEADFIDEFSEKVPTPQGIGNKYFYDPKTACLYGWYNGKAIATGNGTIYTESEAILLLVDMAIEYQDMMFANQSLELLSEQIDLYSIELKQEYEFEHDKDLLALIKSLETVKTQIKNELNKITEIITIYERDKELQTGKNIAITSEQKSFFINNGTFEPLTPLKNKVEAFILNGMSFKELEKQLN